MKKSFFLEMYYGNWTAEAACSFTSNSWFEKSREKRFKFVPPISCVSLKILQKNYDKLKKSQVFQQPRNFTAYVPK